MALFVLWQDRASPDRSADQLHPLLLAEAHIVPEQAVRGSVTGASGTWHFAAFATRTHFYEPQAQIWQKPGEGACIIHGLIWRSGARGAELLDAAAIAAMLDRPGAVLPDDVAGEYAVARIHADGSLTALSDPAGLHQLFHGPAERPVVASRAALVTTILDDWAPEPAGLIWLPVIGYRVGTATVYRAVSQLPQENVLTGDANGLVVRPPSSPRLGFGVRGWSPALDVDLDEGIHQAKAAITLATGSRGTIDLPITGGKDSRVILALSLSAGLHDRLRLFTRGYAGHPDVVAGEQVATALGMPHRREAPHGSDEPAIWTRDRFVEKLMGQTYQTDGMVGGWDLILGERLAAETLISGHMGEVLKAYSKRPLPEGDLDPEAMVRLQAPFDPLGLLRPAAREGLRAQLVAQMEGARSEGALTADLPDLFYYRNRVPNWLGAIRGIKSYERQQVVPLGAPALLRLAFRLTPDERKRELLHYLIIKRCAPELLALPFAHQTWDPRLGDDVPQTAPILAQPGSPALFGNWQYSINHNPAIRLALASEIEARGELTLWRSIDRKAVLDRLRDRRFDYFDGISMLGLVIAIYQEAGLVRPMKLGGGGRPSPPAARPTGFRLDYRRPIVEGSLDSVAEEDGRVVLGGWARATGMASVQTAIEVRCGGLVLANGFADLEEQGNDDGRRGFRIAIPRDRLRDAAGGAATLTVEVASFDCERPIGQATLIP